MSSRGSSQGASAAALRADVHGAVLVAIEAGSGQVGVDHECPHVVSDLRRCISGDVPGLHPGKLLIRGFGVQVPGGAPRLTCDDARLIAHGRRMKPGGLRFARPFARPGRLLRLGSPRQRADVGVPVVLVVGAHPCDLTHGDDGPLGEAL